MRLNPLLAAAASLAFLLPLTAHAAAPSNWPAGSRDSFIKDCSEAASRNVDPKTAKAHCECGANKINAELSTAEIKELMTNQNADIKLKQKAVDAISSCKVVKGK